MTTDMQSAINISWNGYGKVQDIRYLTTQQESPGPLKLSFTYDVNASRLTKTYYRKQGNLSIKEYTGIYIRDPQGNPIATYRIKNDSLTLDELYIYGSSRLGVLKANKYLATQQTIPLPGNNELKSKQIPLEAQQLYPYTKHYELTDWLGNVRVVITNRKHLSTTTTPPHFEPQVVGVRDYYPFGMQVGARSYETFNYKYGFGTQEKDDEITGIKGTHYTAMFWEYDTRLGRRWNVDPVPNISFSNYSTFNTNPINFVDINGDIPWWKLITGWDKNNVPNAPTAKRWHPVHKKYKPHTGTDMAMKKGSSVNSAASGTVIRAQSFNGYGKTVIVDHGSGLLTLYAHLNKANVEVGDKIGDGKKIGEVGNTGIGTGAHLHVEYIKMEEEKDEYNDNDLMQNKTSNRYNPMAINDLQNIVDGIEKKEISFLNNKKTTIGSNYRGGLSGISCATYLNPAREKGIFEKAIDVFKSIFGYGSEYYDDAYFDGMERHEKWKEIRKKL